MKSIWKIFKIILVFTLFLFAISLVWYIFGILGGDGGASSVDFVDYVLYLIGYGEIDIPDHYMKALFSAISLFSLALLSSVFTVSLFDIRNKAEIAKTVLVSSCEDGGFVSTVDIKTSARDVYNVTATLIAKIEDDICSEEQYVPYIPKKSNKSLKFKLAPGSVMYKYLRASMKGCAEQPTLLLTLSYTDIENGQDYKACRKFTYGDRKCGFTYCTETTEKELCEYVESNTFELSLAAIEPINAEDIKITGGYSAGELSLPSCEAFSAEVNMNSDKTYVSDTFTMACLKLHTDGDWTRFAEMGCSLAFDYKISFGMSLTVEFKYGGREYKKLIHSTSDFKRFSLPLVSSDISRDDLASVKELCFTVFYRDVNPRFPKGSFVIKNCALEIS